MKEKEFVRIRVQQVILVKSRQMIQMILNQISLHHQLVIKENIFIENVGY